MDLYIIFFTFNSPRLLFQKPVIKIGSKHHVESKYLYIHNQHSRLWVRGKIVYSQV
jgi:hypothetical protein